MSEQRSRQQVLVVDDEPANIMALNEILRDEVEVVFATKGSAALELASSKQPDLVLLDIIMPEMDGYEVCRRLKQDPSTHDIPIVFLTAADDETQETKGLELGAIDYITKPYSAPIVRARVRNHLELKHKRDELTRLTQELAGYQKRIAAELEMARETQFVLLPSEKNIAQLSRRHDLDISTRFEPSSELGGDLWDMRSLAEDRVALMTVDFSGHGVNAALNTFRLDSILEGDQLDRDDPAAFLTGVNRLLAPLLPSGHFATMFYGIVDCSSDSLVFAGAGSPSPIVIAPSTRDLTVVDASGLPLGIMEDTVYDNRHLEFAPGATLFLYSDGLSEAVMASGRRIGEEGLLGLARESLANAGRDGFATALLARFDDEVARPISDDITVVCLRRRQGG